jgi:hypothetical protein
MSVLKFKILSLGEKYLATKTFKPKEGKKPDRIL